MTSSWRIPLFTIFALVCFAANSVLNRLATSGDTIDAGSYIGIRLVSGAVTLWLINGILKRNFKIFPPTPKGGDAASEPTGTAAGRKLPLWGLGGSAFYLFLYGVTFSFAYRSLTSGTGAFILFGTVQPFYMQKGL